MPETVTFTDRVIDPTTLLGVPVVSLSIEIRNRNKDLKATLVFPAGISEIIGAGPDYSYKVTAFDISDQEDFPGTFIVARYFATTAAGVVRPWDQVILITGAASPTIPDNRTPYIDTVEAEEFFQTRLDYVDWDRFDAITQLRALVSASDGIDGERFKGMKIRFFETDTTRQWPRTLPFEEATASFFMGIDRIPTRVRWATAVQALYLLKQVEQGHDWEARRDMQLKGLTGIQRGDNSETWALEHATRRSICEEAYEMLHPFLAQAIDNMPAY
jgi:hypothetical protein